MSNRTKLTIAILVVIAWFAIVFAVMKMTEPQGQHVVVLDKWWESETALIGYQYKPGYLTGGEMVENQGRVVSEVLCNERNSGQELPAEYKPCDPALLQPGLRGFEYWYEERMATYVVIVGDRYSGEILDVRPLTTDVLTWSKIKLHGFYEILVNSENQIVKAERQDE